jgi:hypothetical protein
MFITASRSVFGPGSGESSYGIKHVFGGSVASGEKGALQNKKRAQADGACTLSPEAEYITRRN